jgi:hypothetical protein
LKDRSAGSVVRYNWIEGGNRQLDLVDSGSATLRNDPRYRETYVYGNILMEPAGDGNRQIVHYGGDGGSTANYRKGTLYFYHNTVVSKRTDRTTLYRLSTNEEQADTRNNILYLAAAGGNTFSFLDNTGTVLLSHNWLKPGWVVSFNVPPAGSVMDDGTSVLGTTPGFADEAGQDYRLATNSACINSGGALSPPVISNYNVSRQYQKHQTSEARPSDGTLDIGAYERGTTNPATPLTISPVSLPNGTTGVSYSATLTATGGGTPYTWFVAAGALPAGLSLHPQSGVISGTPPSYGSSTFTVQVTDAQTPAAIATQSLTIIINAAALQISTTSLPSARVGKTYNQTLTAVGGVKPYTWQVASGSLPPGLTLTGGNISGVPKWKGTWTFTIRVQDAQSAPANATRSFTLIVNR